MNMVAWRKANRLVLMLTAPVFVLALIACSSLLLPSVQTQINRLP